MTKLVCAVAAIAFAVAVSVPSTVYAAKKKTAAPKAPPCQVTFFGEPCPKPGAKTAKK